MVAEKSFRKLDAPQLVEKVAEGKNTITERKSGSPPKSFYTPIDNGSSWGQDMVLMALTGWGQDEDRQRSREAGFNDHLVKPMEYDTLMQLLALSDDQLKIKTPDSPEQCPREKRLWPSQR